MVLMYRGVRTLSPMARRNSETGLGDGILRHVRVGPEGGEQGALHHERAGALEEVHKQVKQLRVRSSASRPRHTR